MALDHAYYPNKFDTGTNDYHLLPPTEKQLQFARAISERSGQVISETALIERTAMSAWIDANRNAKLLKAAHKYDVYPSSKQVAFAERIARRKQRDVPRECFHDKGMMSNWINSNL